MKKSIQSTEWLILLFFYAIVFALEHTIMSDVRHGDPIHIWVMISVTVTVWFAYMLYFWRMDLSGFLKRILIAVPFALTFATFVVIITGTLASSAFALSVYLFLLYKTPNWKQHFSVTLILAFILALALKCSYAMLDSLNPEEVSIYHNFFHMPSVVVVGFFYAIYLRKVKEGRIADLREVLVRTLKSAGAFCLYFAVWLAFQELTERYQISLPMNLVLSSVLTIVFLVAIYLLNLMPVERNRKTKRRSELGELQRELDDFYLKKHGQSDRDQIRP